VDDMKQCSLCQKLRRIRKIVHSYKNYDWNIGFPSGPPDPLLYVILNRICHVTDRMTKTLVVQRFAGSSLSNYFLDLVLACAT
jgi:hypothetical protein